uniref:Nucleotide-diphospho-sugar transferase n=1 Tax=Panagrellus redivivus TaxID=6233 RepID=A0A7E4UUR6_PANRE
MAAVVNRRCGIIFIGLSGIFLLLQYHSKGITYLQTPTFATFELKTCPNMDGHALIASRGVANERVAIVLAVDSVDNVLDYAPAMNTTKCYAKHFGYPFVVINLTDAIVSEQCQHKDVFFKRHCAVHKWMESRKDVIDYVLYIDADMGVINPCHTIQEYIDDTADLVFYDRFYDFEIAAGSYLAKNTYFSRNFLKYWADYNFKLPKSFHGTDNGAVHQVFMEQNFETPSEKFACYDLWNKSRNYDGLFAFQACTQWKLGLNNSKFADNKLKIIRKDAVGWVRDGWLTSTKWAPRDFMLHGWKMKKLGGEWQWPFSRKTFDMEMCLREPLLNAFSYNLNFVVSDAVIRAELDAWRVKVVDKLIKSLKSIGMA